MNIRNKTKHFFLSGIYAVLIILFLPCSAFAFSILETASRINDQENIRIFLRFSELPQWERENSSRRIGFTFVNTISGEEMKILSGDERMIRMVSRKERDNLRISFYFRYPPQKVTVQEKKESNTLIIDIRPGNHLTARHPELATGLSGITILNRPEINFLNPIHASRYGNDWRLFIYEYESKVDIEPDITPTMPPFPIAIHMHPQLGADKWLPESIIQLCKDNKWQQAASAIRQLLETEPEENKRNRLLLTHGEALIHSGNYIEPDRLFRRILLNSPNPEMERLARLLYAYTAFFNNDPHLARAEVIKFAEKWETDPAMKPYLNIFQAELALMTSQTEEASQVLARDNVSYTDSLMITRMLRQADVYYKRGNTAKALVAYRKLENRHKGAVTSCPASLARFSNTLYTYRLYDEAVIRYEQLSNLTINTPWQPLAMFRLAMSRIHAGDKTIGVNPLLARIHTAFSNSEGGDRAALKENDLHFLDKKTGGQYDEVIRVYGQLGQAASTTALREEAKVKQAMVNALAGNHKESIRQAMAVARDFRKGRLLTEAKALIITQLPDLLTEQVQEERFIDALVLAKQNRFLFTQGWLSTDILHDLATAYTEIGLNERAILTYLYILNVAGKEERGRAFLPMLRALYKNSSYTMLEDYADQYYLNYGATENYKKIFCLRLKALKKINMDNRDHIIRLLDDPNRPSSHEIDRIAARIYLESGRWDDTIIILDKIKDFPSITGENNSGEQPQILEQEEKNMLGEALFQAGMLERAEKILSYFETDETRQDQPLFRLAEISLKLGDTDKALKRFAELAEKGKSDLWKKMASEKIEIIKLSERM
jgi:tetratricopeptide (TPR) repeat protein